MYEFQPYVAGCYLENVKDKHIDGDDMRYQNSGVLLMRMKCPKKMEETREEILFLRWKRKKIFFFSLIRKNGKLFLKELRLLMTYFHIL